MSYESAESTIAKTLGYGICSEWGGVGWVEELIRQMRVRNAIKSEQEDVFPGPLRINQFTAEE
jgi:hypothetical protein